MIALWLYASANPGARSIKREASSISRDSDSLVREEGPAVDREDPDRHAGGHGGQPAEHAGLRAVGVDDVGRRAAHEADELQQAAQVADRMERAAHVAQRHEPRAGGPRRLAQRTVAVRRDDHVEAAVETRQEPGDVALGPTGLRERDEDEDPRPAGGRRVRRHRTTDFMLCR